MTLPRHWFALFARFLPVAGLSRSVRALNRPKQKLEALQCVLHAGQKWGACEVSGTAMPCACSLPALSALTVELLIDCRLRCGHGTS